MNTETGRQIAQSRNDYMQQFIDIFYRNGTERNYKEIPDNTDNQYGPVFLFKLYYIIFFSSF